jgi:hypothetical protein
MGRRCLASAHLAEYFLGSGGACPRNHQDFDVKVGAKYMSHGAGCRLHDYECLWFCAGSYQHDHPEAQLAIALQQLNDTDAPAHAARLATRAGASHVGQVLAPALR